jgi:DNA-binding response OmpR family regulator
VVLLVEDHANLAREIETYLNAEGWRVRTTRDGLEGLRLALEQP